MQATTTLKLSGELKERVTLAASASGKTAHAWMVEAIEAQAALAERRKAFVSSALKAEQEVVQYGLVYDTDEVFSYIKAKMDRQPVKRPKARKL
jgi:predicted transcriptional regulator